VVLVKTDVSEELSASNLRVIRIGELGTTLAVVPISPILVTVIMETIYSSETLDLTTATQRNIPTAFFT
jgi:hypothetical protein